MGHDEARKLWEVFNRCSKEVQADYMNERYGEVAYDQSRDFSEEQIAEDIERLKTLKKQESVNQVDLDNIKELAGKIISDDATPLDIYSLADLIIKNFGDLNGY